MTLDPHVHAHLVKILEKSEIYEQVSVDGPFQFTKTAVVYQVEGQLYRGYISERLTSISEDTISDAQNVIQIPKTAYQPRYDSSITRAGELAPNGSCYIKRPSLISFDPVKTDKIAELVLNEVRIYELLQQHPHPNIATYLGCEVQNGYVSGICLTKYPETLMQRVNPRSLAKRAFRYEPGVLKNPEKVLVGVERTISHLRDLGLAHNDLNPSNIMVLGDDTPILIDFGSCRRIGQDLKGAGRTYEWYDERVGISCAQNDFDALKEITKWLSMEDVKNFQFEE